MSLLYSPVMWLVRTYISLIGEGPAIDGGMQQLLMIFLNYLYNIKKNDFLVCPEKRCCNE